MHLFSSLPSTILGVVLTAWLARVHAYFVVNQPVTGVEWVNSQANLVSWTKGVDDGLDNFDLELARLSADGIIFVAQNVPASPGSVNIFLNDIPEGDDYYLLFLNSTSGIMYGSSQRFAIANSGNGSNPSPNPTAATVTVSGSPNPTAVFATTFPPSANGVLAPGWRAVEQSSAQIIALMSVVACALAGAWTVL